MVRRPRLRFLNAALDFAHRLEILADPRAILGSQRVLQARGVVSNPIEEAGPLLQRRAAGCRAAAFAEQPLEDDTGMGLSRQGRRRVRPREIVLIDPLLAVVALADH